MPKQKSHSGSKKRFWLTSTGKAERTTRLKRKTEKERETCVRLRLFRLRRNPT